MFCVYDCVCVCVCVPVNHLFEKIVGCDDCIPVRLLCKCFFVLCVFVQSFVNCDIKNFL